MTGIIEAIRSAPSNEAELIHICGNVYQYRDYLPSGPGDCFFDLSARQLYASYYLLKVGKSYPCAVQNMGYDLFVYTLEGDRRCGYMKRLLTELARYFSSNALKETNEVWTTRVTTSSCNTPCIKLFEGLEPYIMEVIDWTSSKYHPELN